MSKHTLLDDPIIVLGAARSGTTLLAETVLSRHPDIAYWNEPNYVWRYGHAYRRSDVLSRRDATPAVRSYIRNRFTEFLRDHGSSRFMEKSPANCMRMPFVLEVFPRAQVVHVIRHGGDVTVSAVQEWSGKGRDALDSRDKRRAPAPARVWRTFRAESRLLDRVRDLRGAVELPAYLGRFGAFLLRQTLGWSRLTWGPRFPGLSQVRSAFSLHETCALQWDLSVRMARSACSRLSRSRHLEIRYENLLSSPAEAVDEILGFLGLARGQELVQALVSDVEQRHRPQWHERLSDEIVRDVEAIIGSTLVELGYELSPVVTEAPSERPPG